MNSGADVLNAVEISEATAADLPMLAQLAGELGYPTSAAALAPRLSSTARAGSVVFVARAAGLVVGWVQVGTIPGIVEERTMRILGLVVSAAIRGRGYGRALVATAEAWSREHGAERLALSSNIIRTEAHQFYERLGFARTKTQYQFSKPLEPLARASRVAVASAAPGRLFHVSDQPDIVRFEPKPPPSLDAGISDDTVWAIEERRLHNYLLPRNCPRVTFYAGPQTSGADRARFFADTAAGHVVAIEQAWLDRVRHARLWLYELPADTFTLVDDTAGYHVSREAVTPRAVMEISDVLGALCARDVELRIVPSLWPLRDAVFQSTLAFSFIRMRHAQPRQKLGEDHNEASPRREPSEVTSA